MTWKLGGSSGDMQPPQQITSGFSQQGESALPGGMGDGIRARRCLHLHAFMFEQFPDAKYVIGVADGNASMQMVGAHDHGDALGGLCGIGTRGFGNQIGFGDAAVHEVVVADSAFAEAGIGGETSRGDDDRSQATMEEVESVIETGPKYRRWPAVVLGRAKNYDSVGGMQIAISGFADDVRTDVDEDG